MRIIILALLIQGCATLPRPTAPRIAGQCSIVDRIESAGPGAQRWAVIEAPDGVAYSLPVEALPAGIAEGTPLCALERIADLWEPHRLFDCIERGEDVNTCMTEEG